MPSSNNPRRSAGEPRRIKAFEGVRSKPVRGGERRGRPRGDEEQQARPPQAAGPGARADDGPLLDPRSDPEAMFRLLSDKIAGTVERAAVKAGRSAAQKVGDRLTAELDAAIAGAQSTASKMGTLVQQAVQAAVDEALRTAVLNATRVHEEHLAQLALIDRTAQTARHIDAVRLRVEEEMRRSGLARISSPDPESFNLLNPEEHRGSTSYEVLAPAYVDSRTGRIIQRGEMRRVPSTAGPAAEGSEDR